MPTDLSTQLFLCGLILIILLIEPIRKIAAALVVLAMVFAIAWHVSRSGPAPALPQANPPRISRH